MIFTVCGRYSLQRRAGIAWTRERSVDLSLHCLNRFTGGIEFKNERDWLL